MSTLYLRGKSVWIGFTDPLTGARKQKPTGFTVDKVEHRGSRTIFPKHIKDFQRQFDSALVLGRWGMGEKLTEKLKLSETLDRFLKAEGGLRKKETQRSDKLAVTHFIRIVGDRLIVEVNEDVMLKARAAMIELLGEQNTAKDLRHLSGLFGWAVRKEYLKKNPITRTIKLNPATPPPVIFTEDELTKIFETAAAKDHDLANQLMFLLMTGFRSRESCNLTWDRVNFNLRVIHHFNEKSSRPEPFPLDGELEGFLRDLPRSFEPFVFRYRHQCTLSHKLKGITGKDGLKLSDKLTVHSLKKTYVSKLIDAGLSEAQTHILSHHKSFQTTLKYYAQFNIGKLRQALERSRKAG